jgi:phosphoribosylamine--glycine ligase
MKILLVGSGGREHALALGLQADPECSELHVAPGNPGIAQIATTHPLVITDNSAIVALAQKIGAELVVIGPEVPLVNGVADELRRVGIATFGPSKLLQKKLCQMQEYQLLRVLHAQHKPKLKRH